MHARSAPGLPLALFLTACGGSDAPIEPAPEVSRRSVEIYSWWSSPSEAGALERIFEVFARDNPNVGIRNAAEDLDGSVAKMEMRARRIAGTPPDLFQLNPHDLVTWTEFTAAEGDTPRNTLMPLDDLFVETGVLEHLPSDLIDVVSYGEGEERRPYAVPVNMHRQNGMFYNKAVLADAGLTAPQSMDDFFLVCSALQAANASLPEARRVAPLALSRQGWILTIMFRAVIAASAEQLRAGDGAAYLHRLMWGEADPGTDPQMRRALVNLNRVLACSNQPADDAFGWDAATAMLQEGRAAMFVHGDWVKGELVAQGAAPGHDFDVVAAFGTSDLFLYNVDGFAMFDGAPNPEDARRLLEVMLSREAQAEFNQVKGSSPARDDIDLASFDPVAQRTIRELGEATWVVSVERDATSFWDDVGVALAAYWVAREQVGFDENVGLDADVDAVLDVMAAAYSMLRAK